jgi:hypothetical protein
MLSSTKFHSCGKGWKKSSAVREKVKFGERKLLSPEGKLTTALS